ncbi:MAG TPA: hypothetical protein ENK18_00430 [Deltaproteobacteria bacterium]|nr:hypothetical protein [Deltaproteobacteria bacterium]
MIGLLALSCTDLSTPPTPPSPEITEITASLVEGLETVIAVSWAQSRGAPAHLVFRAEGGPWQQSPPGTPRDGLVHQLIVGVPFDREIEYQIVAPSGEASDAQWITTGARPETLPVPIVLHNDPGLWDPASPWLITSMNRDGDDRYGRWWIFIMDREGQIVWAQETPRSWVSRHVSVDHDGRALLVDHDTFWTQLDGGATSQIVRMTLDGTIEHTYDTPGLHHPFVPLPDGVIAWGAARGNDETLEQVDRDGVQEQIWACSFFQGITDTSYTCGSNALWWDERTDHFLFSFWSTDTVVEIDRPSGTAVRWFGDLPGSWRFDPPKSQFWWQHGALFTDEGTLLVSTKDQQQGTETVVREYQLDEQTETLTEIWSFGQGRGVFGPYMGEAHRLSNGNTLHVYGAGGQLTEATPDGSVAWEVTWEGDKHNGRTTPWADLYALLP